MTATYSRTAGETVRAALHISATLAPAGVLGNYDITYNTANFTIAPKAASVTPNAASKTYGDGRPGADRHARRLPGGRRRDGDLQPHGGRDGAAARTPSARRCAGGVCSSNYDITYNTADFTIATKAASVTPNAAGKIYGDADPALHRHAERLPGRRRRDGDLQPHRRRDGPAPYAISATLRRRRCSATTTSPTTPPASHHGEGGVGDAERREQDLRRRRIRRLTGTLAGFLARRRRDGDLQPDRG